MKTLKINNNSITISPEEWLYIDNLVLWWVEISKKYFDEEGKKRWWIFAMIPNAWPWPKNTKIPQHWFVRISKWKFIENDAKNIISQKIVFEENIDFPYLYEIQNDNILFEDKNRVKIIYTIKNLWTEKMLISIWFHPYFKIKDFLKKDIIWDFKGWNKISKNFDLWKNWWTYFFENNLEEYKIFIPELWNLKINFSSNFKKIWVWSPKNWNIICFEPNMNSYNWLTENPSFIMPWETETFFIEISLEKNA
jgi:galactose mutarotase-like enzyme